MVNLFHLLHTLLHSLFLSPYIAISTISFLTLGPSNKNDLSPLSQNPMSLRKTTLTGLLLPWQDDFWTSLLHPECKLTFVISVPQWFWRWTIPSPKVLNHYTWNFYNDKFFIPPLLTPKFVIIFLTQISITAFNIIHMIVPNFPIHQWGI